MARTSAHKRRRLFAAALLALSGLLLLLLHPDRARAVGAGGISAPASTSDSGGTSASSDSGKKGPAAHAPTPAKKTPAKKTTRSAQSSRVASAHITRVSCTPSSQCDGNPHHVSLRGTLLISGVGLKQGMEVVFPQAFDAAPSAHISSYSPAARLRSTSAGLAVSVPSNAHSGKIMVLTGSGRHTAAFGPVELFAHALHPPGWKPPAPPAPVSEAASASAFEGDGMWIWYLSKADGGDLASIVAQAQAAHIGTLYIKSSDGPSNFWSQFTPQLIAELHAAGLKVCAWQFVYGSEPVGEAQMGAQAVADGADCLVIDAEEQYEGRYAAAQTYLADLREKIGPSYPLGLASFPYVFDHLRFPYSVFLGPGGAQFNAPQMYWKTIGDSIETNFADTFIDNRIYDRPIFPLGQTYDGVSSSELVRFREAALDYGASGVSFWDWQETTSSGWTALADPLEALTTLTPSPAYMELSKGSKGDPVLWMQEHLAAAEPAQETSGIFSAQTVTNLEAFQAAHGIAASGICEAATWQALLALTPVPVSWTGASSPAD